MKYYFELITDTEKWYYFEDGFVSEEQMQLKGRSRQCFTMPWLNPADVNRTPYWVNETVWYQISRTDSAMAIRQMIPKARSLGNVNQSRDTEIIMVEIWRALHRNWIIYRIWV